MPKNNEGEEFESPAIEAMEEKEKKRERKKKKRMPISGKEVFKLSELKKKEETSEDEE